MIRKEDEVIVMDMSNQDYQDYVKQKQKKSPMWNNLIWAFLVGGLICTIGQGFTDLYLYLGMEESEAATVTSMTLIAIAALLTGLGWFDSIAKHAGAGTLVPITGFANAMVSPAMEFKSEGMVTGTAVKLFTVAGPVLVFGISTSVIYGLILALCKLV